MSTVPRISDIQIQQILNQIHKEVVWTSLKDFDPDEFEGDVIRILNEEILRNVDVCHYILKVSVKERIKMLCLLHLQKEKNPS